MLKALRLPSKARWPKRIGHPHRKAWSVGLMVLE